MRAHQILVRKVEPWWCYGSRNHILRTFKEILVMWTTRRTIGEDQRWLSAAACATAALGIISRCRGNIAHIDDIEFRYIDTKFHRRRTIQDRQLAMPEVFFAFHAQVIRHLGSMLARFNVMQIGSRGAIEIDEESVRVLSLTRLPGDADRIMKCLGTVASYPDHR